MQTLLPLAERIGAKLKARGQTIAVSESSSGGLVSAALLSVPGASAYFIGGTVIYTARACTALLQLGPAETAGIRSASEPAALLWAQTLRACLRTDWAIAETGAAGPSGNRYGDRPGHTCLAVSGRTERALTLETGSDDRIGNMRAFGRALLELFDEVLGE